MSRPLRLAVVCSHPIQYYAPWFRRLAREPGLELRVFYLWDFGARSTHDPGFARALAWDVPLLDGYAHEFVPNRARRPGTDHFFGLWNPALSARVAAWSADAVLVFGYAWASQILFLARARQPLLFRGDSHRLAGEPRGPKSALKRRLIAAVYRRFTAFLAVGRANADYFRRHGVPDEKIYRCPHAVDHDRFAAETDAHRASAPAWKTRHGLAPETRVLLFVGKLIAQKWPIGLVEAFRRAGLSKTALVFAGSGGLEAELRARARGLPVVFTGFLNQSELPAAYAAADALVLPSLGARETWGLAVNEAMAARLPCIVSSHVGGGADLVAPGRTGWIFEAGHVDALAETLRTAFADPARLAAMGAAARAHVAAGFHYDQATAGLLAALKKCVSAS